MINREVIYDRNTLGSYMKIPESLNAGMDEKLILRKKLKGALKAEKTFVDGSGQYWYDISGKQSLDTYCRIKSIDAEFVERLVVSISCELEVLEKNLIHTSCLVLDPELIFVTIGSKEFSYTLYPDNNGHIEMEFQQLIEYLMTKIDHKNAAAVKSVYEIYEKTLEEGYSIMEIREAILAAKQEKAVKVGEETIQSHREEPRRYAAKIYEASKEQAVEPERPSLIRQFWDKLCGFFRKEKQPEESIVYPEEQVAVIAEEIHPTICLSSYTKTARGMLIYQGTEGFFDISLDKQSIKIGYGADADVRIERATISQLHAKIEKEEDVFYIEDLNSTNGTFVNEEALVYKSRYPLKVNDIVCFADVRYRFC